MAQTSYALFRAASSKRESWKPARFQCVAEIWKGPINGSERSDGSTRSKARGCFAVDQQTGDVFVTLAGRLGSGLRFRASAQLGTSYTEGDSAIIPRVGVASRMCEGTVLAEMFRNGRGSAEGPCRRDGASQRA